MPDVVDVGLQFAVQGAQEGLWAPYKVATWNDIPATAKDPNGLWFSDYGGYIGIGYDANLVTTPPTSFADLLNPIYKNQVALNGDPTSSNSAFLSVLATSVAAGKGVKGANNIQYGLDYWKKLKESGNFVPVAATPATVEAGQTPILLDWDYLHGKYKGQSGKVDWKVVVPSDALLGGFYAQAVVKNSPHPAAARLWQEFLYSDEGQNLWLQGGARPIRLDAMVKAGKHNKLGLYLSTRRHTCSDRKCSPLAITAIPRGPVHAARQWRGRAGAWHLVTVAALRRVGLVRRRRVAVNGARMVVRPS
jgi:putative spermidine/putrescine transport system substrate-binding protein